MYSAYEYFKGKLSADKLVYVHSSLNEKMNFETVVWSGILGGILAAALILVISVPIMRKENYGREEEKFERFSARTRLFHAYVYLASVVYFVILTCIFRLFYPDKLPPYLETIYGVTIAGIIGASLEVICTHNRTRYEFESPDLELEYLKIAQYSAMQFFNTTVHVFMTMLVAFGAFAVVQGFVRIPPEIAYSPQYGAAITCWVLLTLVPILGAGLGILMPALNRVKLLEDKVVRLDLRHGRRHN